MQSPNTATDRLPGTLSAKRPGKWSANAPLGFMASLETSAHQLAAHGGHGQRSGSLQSPNARHYVDMACELPRKNRVQSVFVVFPRRLPVSSSYLLRLFFFLFIYFPSSWPVSTPSPPPTQSDIIVRIPTLLSWHTLEHRAYHAPLLAQSHISFLQW